MKEKRDKDVKKEARKDHATTKESQRQKDKEKPNEKKDSSEEAGEQEKQKAPWRALDPEDPARSGGFRVNSWIPICSCYV